MEEEIKYMIKPDWISWDDVQECQAIAHQKNIAKGFKMHVGDITGEELKKALEKGVCYVALKGKKVVGTTAMTIGTLRILWQRRKAAYLCYEAILPEYQGSEVFFELQDLKMQDIEKQNIEVLYFRTAEENLLVQKLRKKMGYKYISYKSFPTCDYYSVTMAKWIKGKPLPDWILKLAFSISEKYTKFRYKPNRIKRFGI